MQRWWNSQSVDRGASIGLAAACVALGCSVAPPDYTADSDTGSTHVLITVDRRESSEEGSQPRASAFAGFVRTPPTLDQASVLKLAGLALDMPPVGQCAAPAKDRDPSVPLRPMNRVEFLDAGDVQLRVGDGTQSLAPRAFPAVTDLIAGVVYTTRDRAAEPLPTGVRYAIQTAGSVGLNAVNLGEEAPAFLDGVAVEHVPLADVRQIKLSAPIQISWVPGDARDFVYAELSAEGGSQALRCTFRDDAGAGSVPAGMFATAGQGTLALHRVRSTRFDKVDGGAASGEVRFDFERAASIRFEL